VFKAYEKGGAKAIILSKRGRKIGCRTLTPEQEKRLKQAITDHTPDQLKFPFALWTRESVRQSVFQLFRIQMPIRTVGQYLKRWGFSPQNQLLRAYEQKPVAVQGWLDEQYPAIAAKAKE